LAIRRASRKWKDAAAGRIIPGTWLQDEAPGQRVALEELRKDFTGGSFKVMARLGCNMRAFHPADSSMDAYFALVEELVFPVATHMVRAARDGLI